VNRLPLVAFLAVAALAGTSCTDPVLDTSAIRSFDRPVDLAFGCYGRLRILGDNGVPDADDPVVFSAQPLSSCKTRHDGVAPDNAPVGQEDLGTDLAGAMLWLAVAVQPTSGTISLVTQPEDGQGTSPSIGGFATADGDPLTPGHNALAVGSLPLAIATDTAGCHALTANAGSCDLSVIDLSRLVAGDNQPLVSALGVTSAPGGTVGPLLARPSDLVSVDLDSPIGVECPADPQGIVYVAYPDCHAVAAVRAGTGEVVASIKFDATGTPTIDRTGDLSCPRQCGEREPITDGARPVALDLTRDQLRGNFQKLAIGLDNRPVVTVITLDDDGLPLSPRTIELEGDVGVLDVSISNQIHMGGDALAINNGNNDDQDDGTGTDAEFVYAVATDATVRVAEVLVAGLECDTQVDPRYLFDERDPTRLVCFPVGQPGTPPRRAGARGPGIEFPGQAHPIAVTLVSANNALAANSVAAPNTLAGHFAFVALSNGFTAVVNVDDDNYADTYLPTLPLGSVLALALPHQVRDAVGARDQAAINSDGQAVCNIVAPTDTDGVPVGGPRAEGAPQRIASEDFIVGAKGYALPVGHQSVCVGADVTTPVSDLVFSADTAIRERVFPDWRAVALDETWRASWEGPLSRDGTDLVIDGPAIRSGTIDNAGGGMAVRDAGRPFCAAGVEPYDIVTLRGCNPAVGDAECGTGETCYVHPDAVVATGACLPTNQLESLASACRDYLVSTRRYSVFESLAGVLTLHERRKVLRTTPTSGCTSDTQCAQLADYEQTLLSGLDPKDQPPVTQPFTYACEADPSRAPGPDRCVMTCTENRECAGGSLCRGGRCLEGIVPNPECTKGLQRYDLRASDAFAMVGDRTGYVHPIIEDGTGRCVKDPAASPLQLGRFGLTAPPCIGDDPADLAPNPCSETVVQAERVPTRPDLGCPADNAALVLDERDTSVVRFSNASFTFAVADLTYPGDATCKQDRGGGLVDVPTVHGDFSLQFRVQAGFSVMVAGARVVQPSNIVRAPDGSVWVVDAGDIDDNNTSTPNIFGQLIRIDLRNPTSNEFVIR